MNEESPSNSDLFGDDVPEDTSTLLDDLTTELDELTEEAPVEETKKKRSRKLKKRDSSKKRKIDVSAFLDTEAQVGDDEDENYEYDFLLPDESTEAERLEHRSRLKRLQDDKRDDRRIGGTQYLETAIDKLAKRYQDQTFEEGEDEIQESQPIEYDGIEETSALIPDLGDPKLWIVRTNRQTPDRNLAISIMNKSLRYQSMGKNLGIYSCFVPDGVTGYLYIEADNKTTVIEALSEFRQISLNTLKLVPINEMSNVFTTGFDNVYIPRVGEFVRVKFGRYAGDLGQVYESDENTSTVTLKLIPRIDPSILSNNDNFNDGFDGIDSINSIGTVGTAAPVNGVKKNIKYNKMLFDRDAVELNGGLIEHGIIPGTFRYQGMTFLDSGHILQKFSSKRLVTQDAVNPTLAELREFSTDSSLTEVLSHVTRSAGSKSALYKLGDRVKVVKGELMSVTGKIIGVEAEEVEVQPDDKELPNFRINLNSVIKDLVEGDNVRAIGGSNEGKTGLVVMVNAKNRSALVFSPQTGEEFKSTLEHLALIPREGLGDEGSKVGGINGFVVTDLVQTTSGEVGVIISVERSGSVTILTDGNNRLKVSPGQITCKRTSVGSSSRDFNNQPIEPRQRVMVVRGNYRNKTGQVLHLWRNTLFLSVENDVIVVSSTDCLRAGNATSTATKPVTTNAPIGNVKLVRKNPLIGKTVKILQGRYKGLLGDIIHVEPTQFTILLKVKPKTVRYPKSECVILDNWHHNIRYANTYSNNSRINTTSTVLGSTGINSNMDTYSTVTTTTDINALANTNTTVPTNTTTPGTTVSGIVENKMSPWSVEGVVVKVIGPGGYYGKMGVVGEVFENMVDTSLQVLHVMVEEDYIAIAAESVEPVPPSKPGEQALVFSMGKDKFGTVVNVSGDKVTVKLTTGDVVTVDKEGVALMSQQ
ncbi:transcription factor, putative [Theileria annulata]|uniref:Transcription factor, putative n=1 Tax=Theileria annulata TaxID=5874 RepID=Q4UAX3_THEAN|nr:transcription factor, putative [Theileria annulata]CAI76028.1 transcription factor, putative [Theileria annulata]|eukprot:XP_955504.1 transcription factor, putative [Theileria annulata]